MIGRLDPRHREAHVIGGGFAGMLAAYRLDQAGYRVTLYEASDRLGGVIATKKTPYGIAESAAHSLLASPAVVRLFTEIGVPLVPVRNHARFIWRWGKARRFPLSIGEAICAFVRAYFVLADARPDRPPTLADWGRRHLGEAAVRYLLTPFVRGIYGASPARLDLAAAFPALVVPPGNSLLSWLLRKRFRQKGPRKPRAKMVAPRDGMESVVRALEAKLVARLGDRLRRNHPITQLDPQLPNVVLAVPAPVAARLLTTASPEAAQKLASATYTALVSVTAFVRRAEMKRPLEGVGVLFPEDAGMESLGVLFNSSAFEKRVLDEDTMQSFTLIFAATGRAAPEAGDESLQQAVLHDLERLAGVRELAHLAIHRWREAIPLYDERLPQAWVALKSGWCQAPGRVVFGNHAGQVSLRGMIESAEGWITPS